MNFLCKVAIPLLPMPKYCKIALEGVLFLNNWEITAEVIMGDIYIIFTSAVDITAKAVIASNPNRYILKIYPAAPLYLENYLANVALFCEKINLSNDYEKIIDLYSFPFKMEDDYIVTF